MPMWLWLLGWVVLAGLAGSAWALGFNMGAEAGYSDARQELINAIQAGDDAQQAQADAE